MAKKQIRKAKEDSLEEKIVVSNPADFVEKTFAFALTMADVLRAEFLALSGGWEFFRDPFRNPQEMVNNIVPKINPTLNTPLPRIWIEIRHKIIYPNAIRFVFLTLDIS